jgi:hypothetical protein
LFAFGLFNSQTVVIGLIGLAMLGLGVFLMKQKSFIVKIGSASGEANAPENKDRAYIETIVAAVSRAIIDRR